MSLSLIKTNEWRVLSSCSNCPFLDDGKAMHLNEGRVEEIKAYLLENDMHSFSCHKTAHNLDKNMESTPSQKPKMCAGAYQYLKSKNRANIFMRLGEYRGQDEKNFI